MVKKDSAHTGSVEQMCPVTYKSFRSLPVARVKAPVQIVSFSLLLQLLVSLSALLVFRDLAVRQRCSAISLLKSSTPRSATCNPRRRKLVSQQHPREGTARGILSTLFPRSGFLLLPRAGASRALPRTRSFPSFFFPVRLRINSEKLASPLLL